MRHLFLTSAVSDDQVITALARVHGRLRRRRNGLRGVGAAALVCVALLGVGVASQNNSKEAEEPLGVEMESAGPLAEMEPLEESEICGHALAGSEAVSLDLTIRGPVVWPAIPPSLGEPSQVIVVARNEGDRPLTISSPASIVGLADEAVANTEPSASVLMPTIVTLEPSEMVELPAGLPRRSCTGDPLGEGEYALVPIVQIEGLGHSPVVVRGSALSVRYR